MIETIVDFIVYQFVDAISKRAASLPIRVSQRRPTGSIFPIPSADEDHIFVLCRIVPINKISNNAELMWYCEYALNGIFTIQYLSDIMTTSGHGQKNSHRTIIVTGR